MSNHLTFAVATAALCEHVRTLAQRAVPGAVVRIGPPRPAPAGSDAEVTLCLYRATPSMSHRQPVPPMRAPGAAALSRPATGFDLQYFISLQGGEPLAAELIMGAITAGLDAEPVLGHAQIAAAVRSEPFRQVFGGDGAELPRMLEVVAETLTLEQCAALWGRIPASAHPLVLNYLVRVAPAEAGRIP